MSKSAEIRQANLTRCHKSFSTDLEKRQDN